LADWSDSAPVAEGVRCPFGHDAPVRRLVDTIWEAPEGSAEYQCSECDVVFLHPIMSPEEEKAFYEGKFAEYMAKRGQAGGADPRDSFEKWQPEGKRRLELLRPWLREGMSVLEIGAATAFLLDAVRPLVGEVVGIEPGDDFRGFAESELGIEMHRHRDDVAGRRFDLILSYYVVEHLRDPVGELSAWRELLEPGGHLAIEVPNVDDALVKYWQVEAFDRFYWQAAHYFNYSHETMEMVLKMAGFDAVETIPVQRYDISNHIHWLWKGKPGGAGAYTDLLDERVNDEYHRVLRERWLCDTVMAVATNPA
jgi:SAM-dependent methyltransferase